MLPELKQYILDNWAKMPIKDPKPDNLTFIQITSGPKLDGRIKFLLFCQKQAHPFILAKFYRQPTFNDQLEKEYHHLSIFYDTVDLSLRQTLPQPIDLVTLGSHKVMFEGVVEGRAIVQELGQRGLNQGAVTEHFEKAGRWLTKFHHYKASSTQLIPWSDLVLESLQKYRHQFSALSQIETKLWAELESQTRDLASYSLPVTWLHGDFCHKNIMITSTKELRLVDWQYSATEALFARDLFHFPLLYAQWIGLFTKKRHPLSWMEQAFFQSGYLSQAIQSYLTNYMRASQIPPLFTRIFFPLAIIFQIFRIFAVYGSPLAEKQADQWHQALHYYAQHRHQFLKDWPELYQD